MPAATCSASTGCRPTSAVSSRPSAKRARPGEAAERARLLQEALAHWHGAPLADFEGEEFAQADIRRLEEPRLAAQEARIEAELELGLHADVVGELETLVGTEPASRAACARC